MSRQSGSGAAYTIQSLTFTYGRSGRGSEGWGFHHLDCEVAEGKILGIIGPNGSGKTTLLKLLIKILKPQSGMIRLFGKDLTEVPQMEVARLVAFVPQESQQLFPFTIGELVLMGRFPYHRPFDGLGWENPGDVKLARRAMKEMDVDHLAERQISEVSGGERQRALLARALVQEPRVLLLDEPTAFLDLNHQLDIARKLRRLNQEHGLTVVIVSHDLNLASQCCDHLMLLHNGAIIRAGTPQEVIRQEVLKEVYGCSVIVDQHPQSGNPRVSLPV